MGVHWLIEHLRPESALALSEAVEAEGGVVHRWTDEWWSTGTFPVGEGEVAVFQGALENADRVHREGRWRPGAFCNTERLRYSAWAEGLGDLLLNRRWVLTRLSDFVSDPRGTAAAVGADTQVFVRPDSPLKPFSGRVLAIDAVSLPALDHGFYYEDDLLPIIVAPAIPVGQEWRAVVVAGQVVAISGYEPDGRLGATCVAPLEVVEVAEAVAGALEAPEPVYVMDIALVRDEPRVVELNPFSGADLYHCNRRAVVRAIHDLLACELA